MTKAPASFAALDTFIAVAETGGFSAAALRLGVSASAVSRTIARLEQGLDQRLFKRSSRFVSITDDGQQLYEQVLPLLRDLGAVLTQQPANEGIAGTLKVSLPGELLRLLLPHLGPALLVPNPRLRLDLSATDRQVDLIREGFDLAIRIGPVRDSELRIRQLGQAPLRLVAAPSLVATAEPITDIAQLDALPFIGYRRRGRLQPVDFAGGDRLEPVPALQFDTGAAIRSAALAGLGVAQLLEPFIAEDLRDGRLRVLLADRSLPILPISALHAYSGTVPRRVAMFCSFCQSILSSKPG
ncbi:LysR family transcriptional regulator [Frigidibacter sp. MR17.14]|uniref:LysR family transcriptional regulator n=1 Tax=Frigidibacter sp. MR17.14 TaxID=3126509 RepID=UPI003012F2C2